MLRGSQDATAVSGSPAGQQRLVLTNPCERRRGGFGVRAGCSSKRGCSRRVAAAFAIDPAAEAIRRGILPPCPGRCRGGQGSEEPGAALRASESLSTEARMSSSSLAQSFTTVRRSSSPRWSSGRPLGPRASRSRSFRPREALDPVAPTGRGRGRTCVIRATWLEVSDVFGSVDDHTLRVVAHPRCCCRQRELRRPG